jgi:predicted  nucleic acid-binding Zn-ribbon protein
MSYAFKLFRLQQIDSHLDQALTRLDDIEKALSFDDALSQAKQYHSQQQNELSRKQQQLKLAEQKVATQQVKIEQNESTLYGGKVTNPKELQDIQNEVLSLKKYLAIYESDLLDAMIEHEQAAQDFDQAVANLKSAESSCAQKNQVLEKEKDSLKADLQVLAHEREAAAVSIPPEDISIYDQLRKQRRGIAVARLADNSCAACGSTLNAALVQAARSPSQISRCTSCGRILYGG